jgi:hypothetical protein
MGLGVIITFGDDNQLLPDRLLECLTEVRVEQHLDRPTQFAMRFQEDLDDNGQPIIMDADELACERIIAIAVPDGDQTRCLVRGPITEEKCSIALGGPGSATEKHGIDRRVEMSRVCQRRCWIGKASDAACSILEHHGFSTDIQTTTKDYKEVTGTLNQRATDLDFLNKLARDNNLCFWITYECQTNPLDPLGGSLKVEEIANFTSSPQRPDNAVSKRKPPSTAVSTEETTVRLRVNPPPEECQTVTSFDLKVNIEQPTSFEGHAINDQTGRLDRTIAEDRQPNIVKGGEPLSDDPPGKRQLCVTSAGDQLEMRNKAESALTEAGWKLTATARTTAHMLGGVLVPHDVVEVENMGGKHSGPYQVTQVTHTINGADHHMEIKLRRNATGKKNGNGIRTR